MFIHPYLIGGTNDGKPAPQEYFDFWRVDKKLELSFDYFNDGLPLIYIETYKPHCFRVRLNNFYSTRETFFFIEENCEQIMHDVLFVFEYNKNSFERELFTRLKTENRHQDDIAAEIYAKADFYLWKFFRDWHEKTNIIAFLKAVGVDTANNYEKILLSVRRGLFSRKESDMFDECFKEIYSLMIASVGSCGDISLVLKRAEEVAINVVINHRNSQVK